MDMILSFILGMIVCFVMIVNIPAGKVHWYDTAIQQCEKELPRNQKCEITAMVKVNK